MPTFLEPDRDYKFGDARLVEIALEKIAIARRDATELATVGVDSTWVDDFETQVLAFGALPSDTVELGEQKEATDTKEGEGGDLLDKLKDLRSAAKRALGEKSSAYQKFGFADLSKFTDADLVKLSLVLPALTTKYATELATKGWDSGDNTGLQNMLNAFVEGLRNQKLEENSRGSATENRITEGNDVYDKLENELCEAGKSYWRTRSEAKYSDYIIYNTSSGFAPLVIVVTAAAGAVANMPLTGIHPEDVTHFLFATTESDGQFYASDSPSGTPGTTFITLADHSTSLKTNEEAQTELGFSPTNIYLMVKNTGPVLGHYKVTISYS